MKYIETLHQNQHMQGFTSDGKHMYWSFTDTVVKTTLKGTVRRCVPVSGGHLGDIDYFEGKLYASFMGDALPGHAWNDWTSFKICVFDADTLELEKMINLDICDYYKSLKGTDADTRGFQGVDGVAFGKIPGTEEWRMFVACALDTGEKYENNILLRFTLDGVYETEYPIKTGNTVFGIQNLDYDATTGEFWFSTYGGGEPFMPKETLYKTDVNITKAEEKFCFSSAYGFECLGDGKYYCALQWGTNGNRCGGAFMCEKSFFETKKTEAEVTDYIKQLLENEQ
ncbi:MAG: hypothetical protein IKM27_07585 [Clostridia bacterium]|nr:hypothetical protein [Clostridia bacterium]